MAKGKLESLSNEQLEQEVRNLAQELDKRAAAIENMREMLLGKQASMVRSASGKNAKVSAAATKRHQAWNEYKESYESKGQKPPLTIREFEAKHKKKAK